MLRPHPHDSDFAITGATQSIGTGSGTLLGGGRRQPIVQSALTLRLYADAASQSPRLASWVDARSVRPTRSDGPASEPRVAVSYSELSRFISAIVPRPNTYAHQKNPTGVTPIVVGPLVIFHRRGRAMPAWSR